MTRRTNARLAGFLFLFYIAVGLTSLALFSRAVGGAQDTAAKLASLAQHAPLVRGTVVLSLLIFLIAVSLGVTLYALTRDQDRDLALIGLCCRVTEGVLAAMSASGRLELLAIAEASTAATGPDAAATVALGGLMLQEGWTGSITAACFAIGSLLFSWLFLKARSIPVLLAWLGVIASLLLVVLLPAQSAGVIGAVPMIAWMPMLLFEVVLAFWLLIKGAAEPATR